MIFFLCPDSNRPIGGVKQIYHHVSILQNAGVQARVLHTQHGFRCNWFSNDAPVAYLGESPSEKLRRVASQVTKRLSPPAKVHLARGQEVSSLRGNGYETVTLSDRDVIVVPEYHGVALEGAVTDLPVVVFNQNTFGTFRNWRFGERPRPSVYQQANTIGAICVSEHNRQYLQYAFGDLPVFRTINGVDPNLFYSQDLAFRPRRLAFMPRKLGSHLEQVIQILRSRNALDGWELAPIQGMNEEEVAATLRQSSIFLSTCHEEGFGLPPVEAALCGCLIVGYTGSAADEYMSPEHCWPVAQDDVLGLARATEEVMAFCDAKPTAATQIRQSFQASLRDWYSPEKEEASVLAAWRSMVPSAFGAESDVFLKTGARLEQEERKASA